MSTQIPTAYVNQFSANVTMLAQQMSTRLRSAVMTESLSAEFGYFDQIGSVDPVQRTSRHAPTPYTEVPHSRRQVTAVDWEMGEVIDKQDTARILQDPQGRYTRAFAAGMARKMDRTILAAFFADAKTGKAGGSTVSFPSAQQIAVDYVETGSTTNSGLTIGKLRRAREILMDAEAGEDGQLYIACRQRDLNALLRTTEVTSSDYNSVKPLVDGMVDSFMGFKFIRLPSAQFDVDGSSHYRIPCWHQQGMLFAPLMEPSAQAAPDPTIGFNTRLYMSASFGATRMEEARVVEIKCHATTF